MRVSQDVEALGTLGMLANTRRLDLRVPPGAGVYTNQ